MRIADLGGAKDYLDRSAADDVSFRNKLWKQTVSLPSLLPTTLPSLLTIYPLFTLPPRPSLHPSRPLYLTQTPTHSRSMQSHSQALTNGMKVLTLCRRNALPKYVERGTLWCLRRRRGLGRVVEVDELRRGGMVTRKARWELEGRE